ncbi:MAG: hypothetical protein ABIR15_02585 [Chitinophagaceae bacterium]
MKSPEIICGSYTSLKFRRPGIIIQDLPILLTAGTSPLEIPARQSLFKKPIFLSGSGIVTDQWQDNGQPNIKFEVFGKLSFFKPFIVQSRKEAVKIYLKEVANGGTLLPLLVTCANRRG